MMALQVEQCNKAMQESFYLSAWVPYNAKTFKKTRLNDQCTLYYGLRTLTPEIYRYDRNIVHPATRSHE